MAKRVKIREFREEDAEEVSELVKQTLKEINSRDYSAEAIATLAKGNTPSKLKERAEESILVAEKDGEIVGTAGLGKDGGVHRVFVRPDMHGQGIGSALMERIEELAKEQKIKELVAPASLTAVDFYKGLGFRRSGEKLEIMRGVGVWVVVMKKKL